MTPSSAVTQGQTQVVMAVHSGATSVREIAAHCGWSVANTHYHLTRAHAAGLINWTPDHYGSMRPALKVVQHTPTCWSCDGPLTVDPHLDDMGRPIHPDCCGCQ